MSSEVEDRLRQQHESETMSLHEAARDGDVAMVELYLEAGADLSARTGVSQITALHAAVKHNREAVVQLLLRHEAPADARNGFGDTPLHYALRKGFASLVELLLRRGADPNRPMNNVIGLPGIRPQKMMPLFTALERCDVDSVRLLLEHGARVDLVNDSKETPLQVAMRTIDDKAQRFATCLALLDKGALVERYPLSSRTTPLDWAIETRKDPELAELLLARGARVQADDLGQRSPLHLAVRENFSDLARRLLELGANPNSVDCQRRSVLADAIAVHGNERLVCLLLQYGANGDKERTAFFAARVGNVEMMKFVVDRGVEVDIVDGKMKLSLLQMAVHFRKPAVVEYLLEVGASVNQEVRKRNLPLIMARMIFLNYPSAESRAIVFLLVKRIAFLVTVGGVVHKRNLHFMQQDTITGSRYAFYRLELERMKSTQVCRGVSVTYYDLLTRSHNGLVRCLRSEKVRIVLASGDYKTHFSSYGQKVEEKLGKGLQRFHMLSGLQQRLHEVFMLVLPYDVTNRIGEFFSDEELLTMNFI